MVIRFSDYLKEKNTNISNEDLMLINGIYHLFEEPVNFFYIFS